MSRKIAYFALFTLTFCCCGKIIASNYDFSTTPDYSYDSSKSRDATSVDQSTNYSLPKRNYESSSSSFSSNVLIRRNRARGGYSKQQSGYSPGTSGYNAQPASSTDYASQKGYNSTNHNSYPYRH